MTDLPSYSQSHSPGGKELPAGTRIEEFVIERVLGSGGFGITYLARDTSLSRQVVIKENLPSQFAHRDTTSLTIRPGPGREDQENFRWSLENFSREAETLASLRHPGIVPVLRRFEAFGTAYFVMPFVEGITLDVLIEDRRAKGNQFSEKELSGLLERLLDALAHLHDRGIYHRDIKPGNILVTNGGAPVLIDFGSARQRLSERSLTVVESAGYTPFEQLQSRGNVGPWSDLYALGGTLAKAITFETPPKANDRAFDDPWVPLAERLSLRAVYSAGFLAGIDRALAMRIESRWKDSGDWLVALGVRNEARSRVGDNAASAQGTAADPARVQPPGKGKSKALPWVAAACVILGLGAWAMISYSKINYAAATANAKEAEVAKPNEEAAPQATEKQRSPFFAATVKASDLRQLAESGDPLAQALLGHALYCGYQTKIGINEDPSEGAKWIEKSALAGNPLGHYMMGELREGSGKWVPRDDNAAREEYTEAIRQGLVRDAENGGPVWWSAVAQALIRGREIEPDSKKAVEWTRRAAEAGYARAQINLGVCYANGTGVTKDAAEAVKWYRKAADQGNSEAQFCLGECYDKGQGVAKNEEEAVKWIRKAADQGYALAQGYIGWDYANGRGVAKDEEEAVKWYQKAAGQGNAKAQFCLGACYDEGQGVAKNEEEAVKWYRKAADQGEATAQNCLGICYAKAQGVPENEVEAVRLFRKAADQGNANAQRNLGVCYANGRGVAKNEEEAVKWYRKAEEQGHALAQYNLGMCYANGEGVPKNEQEAVKWFQKAADQGYATAQFCLGVRYANGRGVVKNVQEAVKWYSKAADQGNANALINLGMCYENGQGVAKNEGEAVKSYRKAAEQGDATAQCNLGHCYGNGLGVAKNEEEAVKWYSKAADQGYVNAQFNLGLCFDNGRGVAKNEEEAVKWYRKAADQGHAAAQFNIGCSYANGQGVGKNEEEALKWYSKAADQGYALAQFNLGMRYGNGRGVAKNEQEAVKWYQKAAEQGHAEAQGQLGECYHNGTGVAKDEMEAYKWTLLALAQGNEVAKKNSKIIEPKLSSAQRAEGQRLAKEWRVKK